MNQMPIIEDPRWSLFTRPLSNASPAIRGFIGIIRTVLVSDIAWQTHVETISEGLARKRDESREGRA